MLLKSEGIRRSLHYSAKHGVWGSLGVAMARLGLDRPTTLDRQARDLTCNAMIKSFNINKYLRDLKKFSAQLAYQ